MSPEERILRLENAFATLSELAARAEEADRRHEETDRRHEEAAARHEARLKDLAELNRMLVEMLGRHEERNDEFRTLQAESERKIAALADAQIRAGDEMSNLRSAQANTDRRLAETGQKLTEIGQKVAALADAQIRAEDGMNKLREVMAELAQAMTSLTKKVDAITGNGGRTSG